jgi:hypothetical protein
MFDWADELAVAADEPEACIFSTQAGDRRKPMGCR